jgi:uncharacterized protein YjbJ (UPF0337 family)
MKKLLKGFNMSEDIIAGAATNLVGKAENAIGGLIGDAGMQAEGLLHQAKGTAQNLYGTAKDAFSEAVISASPMVRNNAERAVVAAKAHPLLLALFAGSVGFALALTLSGATSRET